MGNSVSNVRVLLSETSFFVKIFLSANRTTLFFQKSFVRNKNVQNLLQKSLSENWTKLFSSKTSRPHVENGKLLKSYPVLHEGRGFLLKKLSSPFGMFGIYSQGRISPLQMNFLDLKIARSHLFCHFFPLRHGCFLPFSQLV